MRRVTIPAVIAGSALIAVAFADDASAAALYFRKVFVKTSFETTCFSFASDAARLENMRNVHKNALEVAGDKDGAYLSITCVGRSDQPAVAVVMSVSDTFPVAKQAADAVADRITGITRFD